MIKLVSFVHLGAAEELVDRLKVQEISAKISEGGNGYIVYIDSVDNFFQARGVVLEFLSDPDHDKYRLAYWDSIDNQGIKNSQNISDVSLKEILGRVRFFTSLIIVACISVYFLMDDQNGEKIFNLLAYPNLTQFPGQDYGFNILKLLSPVFLHFSVPHITFNLIWWWFLGGQIEKNQSSVHLIILTLSIGVISNTAQYLVSGNDFGGLSGVVYGLVAYCWILGKIRPKSGFYLSDTLFIFMVIWLILGYVGFSDPIMGKMANTVHLSGMLSGLLLGLIYFLKKKFV